ncbi:MAG: Bug family tripartite tricarboxylate transporter substrate binding protein [Xanthobacteraceae bacterium]
MLGRLTACIALATLLATPAASAQDWPTRPVRIVNTFAAGGTADVLARTVAEHLSSAFGQQFFVETRPGAGGSIGVQSVVNSPPDGYNFVITNVSLLVLQPLTNPKIGYDPDRDLVNVAYIAGAPVVLSVNAAGGAKTLQDFIAAGKNGAKPLTYSSSGLGSMGHLLTELFAQKAGLKVEHVPYKGAAQSLMDLVGGHIDFSCQTVSSTAAQLRSGALRGLATTSNERLPDYPDLPTFTELGFADLVSTTWFSLSGPAGLPDEIVRRVNREVVRAMSKPEAQRRLQQDGLVTEPLNPEQFRSLIAAETVRWKPVAERAGLMQR